MESLSPGLLGGPGRSCLHHSDTASKLLQSRLLLRLKRYFVALVVDDVAEDVVVQKALVVLVIDEVAKAVVVQTARVVLAVDVAAGRKLQQPCPPWAPLRYATPCRTSRALL